MTVTRDTTQHTHAHRPIIHRKCEIRHGSTRHEKIWLASIHRTLSKDDDHMNHPPSRDLERELW